MQITEFRVSNIKRGSTSLNSRVCAYGARLGEHEASSMMSNHEVDAPTSMDLSTSRPAWSKQSAVALSFDAAP